MCLAAGIAVYPRVDPQDTAWPICLSKSIEQKRTLNLESHGQSSGHAFMSSLRYHVSAGTSRAAARQTATWTEPLIYG